MHEKGICVHKRVTFPQESWLIFCTTYGSFHKNYNLHTNKNVLSYLLDLFKFVFDKLNMFKLDIHYETLLCTKLVLFTYTKKG